MFASLGRARPFSLAVAMALSLIICLPTAAAEPPELEWKTLPEYMAMDHDSQLELILATRRIVMRKVAESDFARAECIGGLFAVTKEGNKQFYNLKGTLKAAAEDGSSWKVQQIIAHMITTEYCPASNN